ASHRKKYNSGKIELLFQSINHDSPSPTARFILLILLIRDTSAAFHASAWLKLNPSALPKSVSIRVHPWLKIPFLPSPLSLLTFLNNAKAGKARLHLPARGNVRCLDPLKWTLQRREGAVGGKT